MINNQAARRTLRVTMLTFLALVTGCGTNGGGEDPLANRGRSNKDTTTVVSPTPMPAPAPSGSEVLANGIQGLVAIADNFTTAAGLETAPGGIAGPSPDDVGAFRMLCAPGQISKDDPVVYPGQPGASHLHQFWGNTGTNANSTYDSLRTTGQTTCGDPNAPINRTAYWMPAMLDGAGHAVKPDLINTYYKQLPANSPACVAAAIACVGLPNGIRMVFGFNMTKMSGGPNDSSSMDYWSLRYECWKDDVGNIAVPGHFHTIADVVAAGCPAGAKLIIFFAVPGCWDGKNLDSADHRSHLTYGTSESGGQKCPSDHPYLITPWQGHIHYTTDANFVAGKWHLSSDEMVPGAKAGSTLHFDYFEAWSPTIKQTWQSNCIDAHKTCSSGDLGNGMRIKGAESPSTPTHQLVTVS